MRRKGRRILKTYGLSEDSFARVFRNENNAG